MVVKVQQFVRRYITALMFYFGNGKHSIMKWSLTLLQMPYSISIGFTLRFFRFLREIIYLWV